MKASLVDILVYYDGPQLALMKSGASKIVAVAVEKDDMIAPFFGCYVNKYFWTKYKDGKADLRYIFQKSLAKKYIFFDWDEMTDEGFVEIIKATDDEISNDYFWPDHGFFSSSHTEADSSVETLQASQVFQIQGTWETSDFSSFYGKISDLYALYYIKNEISSDNTSHVLSFLKENIITRLWRGGGSYSGFYSLLRERFSGMDPLRVEAIQYASPGHISLNGSQYLFEDMTSSFKNYKTSSQNIESLYKEIDNLLYKEKLKKASPKTPIPKSFIKNDIKYKSNLMLNAFGLDSNDLFFSACQNNILVYAKLALSIYRRFNGVYSFIAEGRMSIE